MYKTGVLNSEISKVLSDLGHTDKIIIADCGLPVPQHVHKIDLALTLGHPSFLDVFNLVSEHMKIERMTVATEIENDNNQLFEDLKATNLAIESVSHEELKMLSHDVKAIIRTGEATPYANVILTSGVIF
ncbi:D-ribose pyranase [Staphylococcus gallinarum]|uniref:D-ribose pyranase n=1 Tax=Staphylococcus gallinarum TaxID=1293 RepID=UPI000D1E654C|nr:D-ribose pyranase [Staphylococcus gallinarum]MCD8843108.1 D-ribose pyranase [Staphylococcus gallinarum]PTK93345.1 D-ribose pyranase [Staphylococcus gallinarum]PTK93694.1 D-ribose pyranase [Staphylococcus gallinarum]RIO89249.1 D-ribose pyranase [Staphylococcus gallinarum]